MGYYKNGPLETPEPSNSPSLCPDLKKLAEQINGNYAPLASPALTGTPTAPTASEGTNTTQLATTAFAHAVGYKTGDLRLTALVTLEAGWLKCEGQEVSRTTYKALYEAIGTAYGTGNGSITFNVPDFRGRVPMGAGTGTGGEESESFPSRSLGQKVGALVHKLTAKQSGVGKHGHTDAGHTHTDAGHTHGPGGGGAAFIGSGLSNLSTGTGYNWGTFGETASGKSNIQTGKAALEEAEKAAEESHNIVQPSTVCNVWIKT
jgi:microcystin-dependent protein